MGDLSRSEPDRVLYSPFITSRLSPVSLSLLLLLLFLFYTTASITPSVTCFRFEQAGTARIHLCFCQKSLNSQIFENKKQTQLSLTNFSIYFIFFYFFCVEILLLLLARSVTRVKERMSIPSQFFFIFKFF